MYAGKMWYNIYFINSIKTFCKEIHLSPKMFLSGNNTSYNYSFIKHVLNGLRKSQYKGT